MSRPTDWLTGGADLANQHNHYALFLQIAPVSSGRSRCLPVPGSYGCPWCSSKGPNWSPVLGRLPILTNTHKRNEYHRVKSHRLSLKRHPSQRKDGPLNLTISALCIREMFPAKRHIIFFFCGISNIPKTKIHWDPMHTRMSIFRLPFDKLPFLRLLCPNFVSASPLRYHATATSFKAQ